MKSRVIGLAALLLAVLALYGGRLVFNQDGVGKEAMEARGKPAREIVMRFGAPDRIYPCTDYNRKIVGEVGSSYQPKPPQTVDCDLVYEYSKQLRLILFFVKRDMVVLVYTGLT